MSENDILRQDGYIRGHDAGRLKVLNEIAKILDPNGYRGLTPDRILKEVEYLQEGSVFQLEIGVDMTAIRPGSLLLLRSRIPPCESAIKRILEVVRKMAPQTEGKVGFLCVGLEDELGVISPEEVKQLVWLAGE